MPGTAHQKFTAALDDLVEQIRKDRTVLAAILCGSLSHDTVWDKSDIDLALITIDDKKTEKGHLSLYADGVNVHAFLIPRAEFRKSVQSAIRNSFMHSLIAKGRILYTHDESIAAIWDDLHSIGERDTQIQLLAAACHALPSLYKAHKWMITRRDLDYTALWILYAATAFARIEVLGARLLADREVLPQALKLNPAFFKIVYTDLLNSKKTTKSVEGALRAADGYVAERTTQLFGPLLEHLEEAGEARTATDIEDYFHRNLGIEHVTTACEYLADQGLIGKASLPARITKRSNAAVEELAFFHNSKSRDAI